MTTSTTIGTHHNEDGQHNTFLLFGTLNQDIADVMYESIQTQLRKSLQALPMLNDTDDGSTVDGTLSSTRTGLLQEYLLKQYIAAADLIELYNTRNTFSIHMIQPASRQNQVLEYYRTLCIPMMNDPSVVWNDADWMCSINESDTDADADGMEDAVNDDHIDLPTTMEEIPTAADLQTLQTDITTLHDRYQQLQQQQAVLNHEIKALQALQEQQQETISAPVWERKDQLTHHISQTVPVLQTLRECQTTSEQLQQQMTNIEQQRNSNTTSSSRHSKENRSTTNLNDIVMVRHHPPASQPPPPLPKLKTIQERYERDSCMVVRRGDTTNDHQDGHHHVILSNLLATISNNNNTGKESM